MLAIFITYQHFETVPIFPLATHSPDSSSWFPCYLKPVLLSQVKTSGRLLFSFEKKLRVWQPLSKFMITHVLVPPLPVFSDVSGKVWPRRITSVMIYHCGASLSEQHTDLLICHCTKQDLSHTSTCRYVEKSSPEIARYCIRMPTAREATLSEATYA